MGRRNTRIKFVPEFPEPCKNVTVQRCSRTHEGFTLARSSGPTCRQIRTNDAHRTRRTKIHIRRNTMINFLQQKWPMILGVLTTISGICSDPNLLNLLPQKYSVVLTAIGAVILAITKPIQHPVEPPADPKQ